MKRKIIIRLLLVVILLGIPSAALYSEYQRFMSTPIEADKAGDVFNVERGSNLSQISQRLYQQNISPLPSLYLDIYGRLKGLANQVKAGEYRLEAGMTLPELLDRIVDGDVVQYQFTIVEGMTTQQLLLALRSVPHVVNTIESDDEAELLSIIDADVPHAEGWFLPETYHFPSGTTDKAFLKRAYQSMQKALEQAWQNRADDLPYETPYEALIMASIIEKETGIAEERPQIAGVFVRRLEKGMRLQTDPTVIYGIGADYDGNIRRKDLRTDTPYNTYTRHGLPPTPIALPSRESIEAALNPADGDSLYFVATGKDGRHYFSSTLQEHNKAVRRYQLNSK